LESKGVKRRLFMGWNVNFWIHMQSIVLNHYWTCLNVSIKSYSSVTVVTCLVLSIIEHTGTCSLLPISNLSPILIIVWWGWNVFVALNLLLTYIRISWLDQSWGKIIPSPPYLPNLEARCDGDWINTLLVCYCSMLML